MKKTLRTLIYIATVFLVLVVGCKKEIKNASPLYINSADSNLVTPSVAVALAQHVASSPQANKIINSSPHNNVNVTGGTIYSGTATKQILDSLAVPDNVNPSYYIFNYVGGGFLVLSADKRTDPILAFSNSGYFNHAGSLPNGLVNWLSLNHKNMQLVRKNRTLKASKGVKRRWDELFQNSGAQSTPSSRLVVNGVPPAPNCDPRDSILAYIGPLLQTAWAQGVPYNGLCPTGTGYYYGSGHMPTGCVATAMAQVLYIITMVPVITGAQCR